MAVMHGLGIGYQSIRENQPGENPQQAASAHAQPGTNRGTTRSSRDGPEEDHEVERPGDRRQPILIAAGGWPGFFPASPAASLSLSSGTTT